ncbi:MAG: alpha/beta hydrolase [Actinomycetota bacterium]|nr:alpha/beta hydrolase [Actinomycetota bacterium]
MRLGGRWQGIISDVDETVLGSTERRSGVFQHAGHALSYYDLGPLDGPAILLVHGLVSDSSTWQRPADGLAAAGFRVIAPDLLGHGASDKPVDGGYHLPGFAAGLHALLLELGVPSVTVIGHSLGGAVAMQLAHDCPELVHRLVLVSAGGLGRKVHPILRVATLPGAHRLLRLAVNQRTAAIYRAPRLHRSLRLSPDVVSNLGRAGRGLVSPTGRAAFFQTLHNAINPAGQRGSMLEQEYLPRELPTLIIWSQDDPVVPVVHAHQTHAHLPNSRLEIFPGSTHQPHHHSADRFVDAVSTFIRLP